MFSRALCADLNGEKATSFTTLWNLPTVRTLSSTCGGSGHSPERHAGPPRAPPSRPPPSPPRTALCPLRALGAPWRPELRRVSPPPSRPVPYLRQQQTDLLHLAHGEQRVPGGVLEQHVQQHLSGATPSARARGARQAPLRARCGAGSPDPNPDPRPAAPPAAPRPHPRPAGRPRSDAGGFGPARAALTIVPPAPPGTESAAPEARYAGNPPRPHAANRRRRRRFRRPISAGFLKKGALSQ